MRSPLSWACAALGVLLLSACQAEPTPPPPPPPVPAQVLERPNFLVLVPDSLRADRVNSPGDGPPVAPTLAALAARGTLFEANLAQAGWTMPALATILTGRYPVLPTADSTMLGWMGPGLSFPEILALYGYGTTAFLGANAGSMEQTIGSRFDHVVAADAEPTGRGVTDDLAGWLQAGPPEPFLAFVHDIDLQFVATVAELDRYPGAAERCQDLAGNRANRGAIAIGELMNCLTRGEGKDKDKDKDKDGADPEGAVIAAYDRALSTYDGGLADVIAALDSSGLAQRTVVILTSPHGHHLGENGRFQHGTLNEPDLQIPLIWVDPSAPQPGQRVPQQVQQLDLAPSILARAGATQDASMPGQPLLPLMGLATGEYQHRDVFHLNDQRNMALRSGSTKLIRFNPGSGGPRGAGGPGRQHPSAYLFFDLEDDPMEREDLAKGGALGPAEAMRERLDAFAQERIDQSKSSLPNAAAAPDPALRKHLQEHGYWHHVDGGAQAGDPQAPAQGAP